MSKKANSVKKFSGKAVQLWDKRLVGNKIYYISQWRAAHLYLENNYVTDINCDNNSYVTNLYRFEVLVNNEWIGAYGAVMAIMSPDAVLSTLESAMWTTFLNTQEAREHNYFTEIGMAVNDVKGIGNLAVLLYGQYFVNQGYQVRVKVRENARVTYDLDVYQNSVHWDVEDYSYITTIDQLQYNQSVYIHYTGHSIYQRVTRE